MAHINTVTGKIAPENLGFCLSHEHLCITKGRSCEVYPPLRIDDVDRTSVDLRCFRKAGGMAVVDAQPIFCGRDAAVLRQLSDRCSVYVIASTGFHRLIYYPDGHRIFEMSEDELTALFIGEIEVGILMDAELSDTGGFDPDTWTEIRAGQIKTALEPEFTKLHAKLFASAARAATKTGAPIMVHIEQGADPVGLADFMEKRGVCSDQMIFCHMDRAVSDPAVHRELCGRGIYLEYDTVAREKYHSDEDEISIVMERIIEGFGDKLLMSLDVTRERLVGYGGTVGLDYMQRCFIPRMRDAGVCAETIKKIFIENPRRAFSI